MACKETTHLGGFDWVPELKQTVRAPVSWHRAKDTRFPMLVMAPEGTCGDGRCILRFRTGAFVPGVPVLPICFRYNKRRINPAWTIINEGWHLVSCTICC